MPLFLCISTSISTFLNSGESHQFILCPDKKNFKENVNFFLCIYFGEDFFIVVKKIFYDQEEFFYGCERKFL